MTIFSTNIHQKVWGKAITTTVCLSLFWSFTPSRMVNAEMFTSTPEDAFEAQPEPLPEFPVAEEREPLRTVVFVATAYNSLPWQTDSSPCITANGHDLCRQFAEEGFGNTIATNDLPFGTVIKIPEIYGDKLFVVRDRMNAKYTGKRRLDIWMNEYPDAKKFGVKRIKVEIYPKLPKELATNRIVKK